jgi:hypothetical protein
MTYGGIGKILNSFPPTILLVLILRNLTESVRLRGGQHDDAFLYSSGWRVVSSWDGSEGEVAKGAAEVEGTTGECTGQYFAGAGTCRPCTRYLVVHAGYAEQSTHSDPDGVKRERKTMRHVRSNSLFDDLDAALNGWHVASSAGMLYHGFRDLTEGGTC